MKENKYLNEETYKKGKSFLIVLAIIILVIGIGVGSFLIMTGISKSNSEKAVLETKTNETKNNTADIQKQIDELASQISTKENECHSLDIHSSTWYADHTKCTSEVSDLRSKKSELEMQVYRNNFDTEDDSVEIDKEMIDAEYAGYYMFGGFIILASIMISVFILMLAHRRQIAAFTTQQTMPVAQEAIDTIAPTIGNAAGEIAKGIKTGLNEADKKE